ncbi:MAG TPA: hypothetical protein VEQ63_00610 [Bryobacteraceae bacterium]|nr:hypothetical protein [Bryobacteraceae bacterium]
MVQRKALRISHVGLRGVVGSGLTAAHVIDFASAFGTFLEPNRQVVIGRDPRTSGNLLREGVGASLLACGHQVVDLGIVSSPVIQHAIRRRGASGGISITASHNSIEWNALKFFGPNGTYLSTAEAGELLDIYHLRRFRYASAFGSGKLELDDTAIDRYIDELVAAFNIEAIRHLRVVVDCCNGTSAALLRRLCERTGLDFVLINASAHGASFAHDPLISSETIALQLAPLMKPLGADVGFQFDIDSDRAGMATHNGDAVSEELMLPLIADYLLPHSSGRLVITNLSSTSLIEEVARRYGGKVIRVPVGRQATIDALARYPNQEIAVAGEGTGAIMMPRFEFIYDGIAAMLGILSLISERGENLSTLIDGYPRFFMRKVQLPLTTHHIPELFRMLQKQYKDARADLQDGLRLDWPDAWAHVRVSQTEPVIRVICEKRGQPPDVLFESIVDKVRNLT